MYSTWDEIDEIINCLSGNKRPRWSQLLGLPYPCWHPERRNCWNFMNELQGGGVDEGRSTCADRLASSSDMRKEHNKSLVMCHEAIHLGRECHVGTTDVSGEQIHGLYWITEQLNRLLTLTSHSVILFLGSFWSIWSSRCMIMNPSLSGFFGCRPPVGMRSMPMVSSTFQSWVHMRLYNTNSW
jgi:hypothetical protein